MDISDKATEREEQFLADALARRKPAGPEPCGQCHYCGEALEGRARFCPDNDCAKDFEYETERRRVNGAAS